MICSSDGGLLGLGSHNDVIVRERASCLRAVPSGNGLRQSGVVLSSIRNAALNGPLFHVSIRDAALKGPLFHPSIRDVALEGPLFHASIRGVALEGTLFHGSATEALMRKQIRALAFEWFGVEAQDVPVGIFDVKLQGPTEIGEGHADGDSAGDEFVVEPGGILDADPDPGGAASLAAAAEIDAGTAAVHGRELVRAPTRILKSQFVDVEGERGLHVVNAQDRLAVFEVDAG